ncbi:conserved hypothetical protein [Paecilomyces variotii No. 5]|uniref:HEAT repeat protein n=1 Tax=Byssochlamys spectabilis (strain No. 5 / NBRC 109023) TaxID=1356009 RepID=V5FWQ9_BYSSN|nr:conserved hypothetical protein [Paecilomyces variotii No. 5]
MEDPRQEAFKKLRPPCVELSSVGLKFRAHQTTTNDVLHALEPVHKVLEELGTKDVLDEKLAEYAFFPLSHVFNETKRLSARCLEIAVDCLRILVERGWRRRLSPQMGKQLIILMTILVGGSPSRDTNGAVDKLDSEELAVATFRCLAGLFTVLEGPVAERTIFNEVGTATVIDQTVYVLLEGLTDGGSSNVQEAAVTALRALCSRITDRVVLASIMPRTVSALTKIIKPTTQARRSFRLLQRSLNLFTDIIKAVLRDDLAIPDTAEPVTEKQPEKPKSEERIALDESWLKATAGQIKIALANVIQIRRHEKSEVKSALLDLCLMVIETCPQSLQESLPLVVETVVVLAGEETERVPNDAHAALKHIAITYTYVVDILKDLLHTWVTAFPRTMQGNDEAAKQRAIKQISTAFNILSEVSSSSSILDDSIASGLCDSVTAVIKSKDGAPQALSSTGESMVKLEVLRQNTRSMSFPPVLLEHRSQKSTLKELRSLIIGLSATDSGGTITRSIMNRISHAAGDSVIAPFWLTLNFLKRASQNTISFDDILSLDSTGSTTLSYTRSGLIEELYYDALPILNEAPVTTPSDWRVSALAMEAVALQAQEVGEAFRPELIDALYPVLRFLASNNTSLQDHAMTCLNILTTACNYPDTSTMLIENVDYLVNSISLKLNTFDVSPYPPQVLLMMVRLCGASLIPYLDDLVDSIFGILDMYHGYPRLVELLFSTLTAIVEEGVKKPALLSIEGSKEAQVVSHKKRQYEPIEISKLAEDLASRRSKRVRYSEMASDEDDQKVSHPNRPWTTALDGPEQPREGPEPLPDSLEVDESEGPLPPPREPGDAEKPLSKSHSLLLHIVKSIPPHLSSPSPLLRRSLLSILTQALPVLALNETSFLPLINDLWPSVSARITAPASLTADTFVPGKADSASTALSKASDNFNDHEIKEEVFVTVSACSVVETMCKATGDFMATRVENEFPRWKRLYHRAWEKVLVDAERAKERRFQRMKHLSTTEHHSSDTLQNSQGQLDMALSLGLSSGGPEAGNAQSFTPHHSLWKALASLFIALLTHVRLPLAIGDEICDLLGLWISAFAGPDYYIKSQSRRKIKPKSTHLDSVEHAIEAMESWNSDLTWFIFQQVREQDAATTETSRPNSVISTSSSPRLPASLAKLVQSSNMRFAELVF